MAKSVSLRDSYNSTEAFEHSDPMIRIAAIHHLGSRLEKVRNIASHVIDRLQDDNPLVSRYAAVTLAQAGLTDGLVYLQKQIQHCTSESLQQELDAGLRNCSRFPFAILLNELGQPGTIAKIKDDRLRYLCEYLQRSAKEEFYERVAANPDDRDAFIELLCSIDRIPGFTMRKDGWCGRGFVLSTPRGKQPGFIFCESHKAFLKFEEDDVLNRDILYRGSEVLVTSTRDANDATLVYILEDQKPAEKIPFSRDASSAEEAPGMLPGMVVSFKKNRAVVLCPAGKWYTEGYRSTLASVGQLVLTDNSASEQGERTCHFIPRCEIVRKHRREMIAAFAHQTDAAIGTVIDIDNKVQEGQALCTVQLDSGESLKLEVGNPVLHRTIVVERCSECKGDGVVACFGKYPCPECRGKRKLGDGRACPFCQSSGERSGCNGEYTTDCAECQGNGIRDCYPCRGTGEKVCGNCRGTGEAMAQCQCKKCKGMGTWTDPRGNVRQCNARRLVDGRPLGSCNGTGLWAAVACEHCHEGRIECSNCHGHRQVECFHCHGDRKIECSICKGQGQTRCRTCSGEKWRCSRLSIECELESRGKGRKQRR